MAHRGFDAKHRVDFDSNDGPKGNAVTGITRSPEVADQLTPPMGFYFFAVGGL